MTHLPFSPWKKRKHPAPGVPPGRSPWNISPSRCPPHLVTPHHQRLQTPPARWRKCSEYKWTNRSSHISRALFPGMSTPCTQCFSYLEGDAAHGQILAVLQHAQVLGHQSGAVHQTLGRLSVVVPLRVFARHVLKPRQPQVRRCLVALCNPGDTDTSQKIRTKDWQRDDGAHSAATHV